VFGKTLLMGNFASNRYIRSQYDANKLKLPVVGMCAAAGGFSITADRIRGHVATLSSSPTNTK